MTITWPTSQHNITNISSTKEHQPTAWKFRVPSMDEARLVPALLWTYDVHPRLTINHLNTKQIFNISSIYQEINMRRSWCSPTTGRNLMGATLDPRTTENRWWLPWTPWWELPWTQGPLNIDDGFPGPDRDGWLDSGPPHSLRMVQCGLDSITRNKIPQQTKTYFSPLEWELHARIICETD